MTGAYRAGPAGGEALRRVAAAGLLAAWLGGCSFAIPSLAPKPEDTTGSIPKKIEARLSPDLAGEDWRRAKGALALALDPQGNGRPVKWENPESRMRGEVASDGAPFVEVDEVCRKFTASIEAPSGKVSELAGRACREGPDEWAIKKVAASG